MSSYRVYNKYYGYYAKEEKVPSMSIYESTQTVVLKEMDHLLLRRHRLAEFNFSRDQLSRVFFTHEEWARVNWLMKDPKSREALHRNSTVLTEQFEGYPFRLEYSGADIVLRHPGPQTIHLDNEVGPYFQKWAKAQAQIADENRRAYTLIETVMRGCTTWMQVKKAWPEIVQIATGLKNDIEAINQVMPAMSDVDARRANNPGRKVGDMVHEHGRFAGGIITQAMLLPPLDETKFDSDIPHERLWNRYRTRPLYKMKGIYLSSSRWED